MEEKVLEILKDLFELDSVDETCSQTTCEKWDSMGQLNLVVELESEFDVSLEPEEIGDMKSFEDVIRILKTKVEQED
ncbi:MAG: acyl carrier protein [Prevotella sp.]|nr:acyl carrier protein [Prevotella sp.]